MTPWSALYPREPRENRTSPIDRAARGRSLGSDLVGQAEGCVNEACAVGVAQGAKVDPEPILAALEG
jgi:hypothetical protein